MALVEDGEAMEMALAEARFGAEQGEAPVGAVVVRAGAVLARRHNEREQRNDPTAHAEILAIGDAARAEGSWRLEGSTVVVTLEPCAMCAGALVHARVARVVFGADDPKAGACGSLYNLCADPRLNHEVEVSRGLMADESSRLLRTFFGQLRATRSV